MANEGTGKEAPAQQQSEEPAASKADYVTLDTFNAALANHGKRLTTSFQKMMTETVGSLAERMSQPVAQPPADATPEPEWKAQLSAMQKRVEAAERKATEAESRRAEQEAARTRDEERSSLASALRQEGLDETRIKAATALLYTEEKRIVRSPEGKIAFKLQRQGFEDEVDLSAGIKEWLKTDDGKAFMPARGVSGSGATAATNGSRSGGKPSKAELREQLARQLFAMKSS